MGREEEMAKSLSGKIMEAKKKRRREDRIIRDRIMGKARGEEPSLWVAEVAGTLGGRYALRRHHARATDRHSQTHNAQSC